MIAVELFFWLAGFCIVWAMAGYQYSLKLLDRLIPKRGIRKNYEVKPTVTVMIVAHNEEKVIRKKLENVIANDYPADKIDYLVTSDYSTDRTNEIVETFIAEHPSLRIRLYQAVEHKGKTNAQNEAQKLVDSEILVMTDANAMFAENTITELAACFPSEPEVAYVTGKLQYINTDNDTAAAESLYWEGDLAQRQTESDIRTITAGNGAVYACRNAWYFDCDPIKGHDAQMPRYYGLQGLRAVYNPDAVAYEKAGEVIEDEFKRKVRMNRGILPGIKDALPCINIFRHGWFAYFYFGHRLCRRLLWIAHAVLYAASGLLAVFHVARRGCRTLKSWLYAAAFVGQTIFLAAAGIALLVKSKKKPLQMAGYYTMTVAAQWVGVYNCLTGKSKAVWEKAETTR